MKANVWNAIIPLRYKESFTEVIEHPFYNIANTGIKLYQLLHSPV